MKRYLIRADFDPAEIADPMDYVSKSFVGGNSGNLMYAYGVMNTVKTTQTELEYTYKWQFSDAEVDGINQRYDAFIIPMADAFRKGFVRQLEGYTEMIKRLRIPVVIPGIGLRADYEPDFKTGFEFDGAAKAFVGAALEKTAVLGLRGEITADYLKHLGFTPERDYTPIGCPSLYTYGDSVRTRELRLPLSKLALNANGYYNIGFIQDFIRNTEKKFPECFLIQQMQDEFLDLYLGNALLSYRLKGGQKTDKYIISGKSLDKMYREDRVRFFFDVPSWINYIRSFDLFVGNRFHGAVAAVLSGTPCVMIPFNARTREMTEYHHLTSLKPEEIRQDTCVTDYLDGLDFHLFQKHQSENLDRYVRFLEKNGLQHVFSEKTGYEMGESPLERELFLKSRISAAEYNNVLHDFKSLSFSQKARRAFISNWKDFKRLIVGK